MDKEHIFFEYLFKDQEYNDFFHYIQDKNVTFSFSESEVRDINILGEFKRKGFVEKQHFVQKGYLKKFLNQDGKVYSIEHGNKKASIEQKSVKSLCMEKYFYSLFTGNKDKISQVVESYLGKYEDRFGKIYSNIRENIFSTNKIDEGLIYELCFYIIISWLRSKNFREDYKYDGVIKDNLSQLRMLLDEEKVEVFANLLFNKKLTIYYINTGDIHFTTSENIVTTIYPTQTVKTSFGVHFFDRIHYFALSPDILLEFKPYKGGKKITRKLITNEDEIIFFNLIRSVYSKFLFSDNILNLNVDLYTRSRINNIKDLFELFGDHDGIEKDLEILKKLRQRYHDKNFLTNFELLEYYKKDVIR